jgi:hypothetical protein
LLEQRQYVRMSTVFPVELELGHLIQGFTRDVSDGGMCIELKIFDKDVESFLQAPSASFPLTINPSFSKHPIKAHARVAWLRKVEDPAPPRYLIGVAYTEIDDRSKRRIIGHAKRLRWIPRVIAAIGIALLVIIAGLFIHDQKLILENKSLVNELVQSASIKSEVASDLYKLQKRKTDLERELTEAKTKISSLESAIAATTEENLEQKKMFEKELGDILQKEKSIGTELDTIKQGREKLQNTYQTLQANQELTSSSGLRQMYGWLKTHQNHNTGLVASFEGDLELEDIAFTYDQSLVCQTFLLFGDIKNAEAILKFYADAAEKKDGGFYNAYSTIDGKPTELSVNTGPNLWIGIAAIQYEHHVRDGRFLPLAKTLGDWVLNAQDSEGGISGGPGLTWYSTEHHLDAYAFLSLLYAETGDEKYLLASNKTLEWIKTYAYSHAGKRMQRGKGDSTIATDTFSWAIAAIGPEKLERMDTSPSDILDFAEKNCEVSVVIPGPDGKSVSVKGFDFAKAQNVGRGGIVSTEWTAQMIVAYQVLEKFYRSKDRDRATLYKDKANFYLNELQKLIITSPSRTGQGRGCLPYASLDNVDTGHGWRTPKGRQTGSVAGTAYGIFAWVNYNPFAFENNEEIR